jgi:hypothetical protein
MSRVDTQPYSAPLGSHQAKIWELRSGTPGLADLLPREMIQMCTLLGHTETKQIERAGEPSK